MIIVKNLMCSTLSHKFFDRGWLHKFDGVLVFRCFSWRLDSVSSCWPQLGNCGAGLMTSQLSCRDMWGNEVEEERCNQYPRAFDIPLDLNCSVPCSNDCVVSEWSSWSPCPYTCKQGRDKSGVQTR